jgi:urease accessory protein
MGWHGSLHLEYRAAPLRGHARTVLHDRHDGPLRVLSSLYPEDPQVCHNVLVHPPGGLVAGDVLDVTLSVGEDAHALITTPGATRCYRSTGESAVQRVHARLQPGARLEWLPLETIAYSGCIAENQLRFELEPGAEMIGWDLLALGLPSSEQPFERGRYTQSIEMPGVWLERGHIDSADTALLDSPLGWAGRRVMGTLWFHGAAPLRSDRLEALLEAARADVRSDALRATAGVSAVRDNLVVLRVLAPRVEPAMALLSRVWASWRQAAWQRAACTPRVWRT